ncbi:MAG: acyloxyacyl hydrolase, partial [Duncaniella sp.]|nr:acyloxyacyl hydrolase [Duncaniella sp.]
VSWGLSARGELGMPIFSINAGMGYNLFGNTDAKNFYQVLALKIHLARSFFLHVGYQLNSFKNPNNLMIGVGYRFHDRR